MKKSQNIDNVNNDKYLKTLRELVSSGSNRQCFDCFEKGVTYVNMTVGSFCCTSCSGILRGLTPPHRVKSISMAKFTDEEIEFLRLHGNDECSKTWLGLWDYKRTIKQDHKEFMSDKYEKKRYYLEPSSPLKSIKVNGHGMKSVNSMESFEITKNSTFETKPPITNGNNRSNSIQENLFQSDSQRNSSTYYKSSSEFVADFSHANAFNAPSLSSSKSEAVQVQQNNNVDMNANFADFENNKIYNATDVTTQFHNLKNGFNNNFVGITKTTSDKYAALKDLDEQFREAKHSVDTQQTQNDNANGNFNPFKNPFQESQQQDILAWNAFPETSTTSNMNCNYSKISNEDVFSHAFQDNFPVGNPFMSSEPIFNKKNPFL